MTSPTSTSSSLPTRGRHSQPSLQTLPQELLIQILKLLPLTSIFKCEQVSKTWSVVIQSSTQLWKDALAQHYPPGCAPVLNVNGKGEAWRDLACYYAAWDRPWGPIELDTIDPIHVDADGLANLFLENLKDTGIGDIVNVRTLGNDDADFAVGVGSNIWYSLITKEMDDILVSRMTMVLANGQRRIEVVGCPLVASTVKSITSKILAQS